MTEQKLATRGTSNGNVSGSSYDRRRRRAWLVETYRADVDLYVNTYGEFTPTEPSSVSIHACRCYRCGELLTVDTVTVDRIIPGCKGGTYRRNNIRPACGSCNSITGNQVRWGSK
ncbi:HNH endonuclease signature motif containing protein [Kribbella sp. NPDC051718]|uniref:HNH endonuclease n=1 Tax=Kribbella sp. NPDC051718 TaxID=3155168 RepID=UPI00343B78C4